MVKNKQPSKTMIVSWIEKYRYTLIEQLVLYVCQQLAFTISLAIAVNDSCIKFRYINYTYDVNDSLLSM